MPPERARRLPARASARCSTSYGYERVALRPLRPGLRPHAASTSTSTTRDGHRSSSARSSTRRPTSSSRYGGSLSGEHGDGQSRAELLPKMFGDGARSARSASSRRSGIPDGKMNPGKVVDPYPHRPRTCGSAPTTTRRSRETHFHFPDDDGSFAHATLRCVGVGECRRTRRRRRCARATWSRARRSTRRAAARACSSRCCSGDALTDGWRERGGEGGARPLPVLQGLQGRLPGQRGHGHYKAEFLSHYYERPAAAAARLRDRA